MPFTVRRHDQDFTSGLWALNSSCPASSKTVTLLKLRSWQCTEKWFRIWRWGGQISREASGGRRDLDAHCGSYCCQTSRASTGLRRVNRFLFR